jgi:hypothetical protein
MSAPALSDEQVAELVGLIGDSDSVELKVTVPEPDQRSAMHSLGMDPIDARIRQVFFFDTPDLDLYEAGVVVRARRMQGKGDDSIIKLRPVVPNELPRKLRRMPGFGVEVDATPGGFVCSGRLRSFPVEGRVKEAVAGERPIRKLFSKAQRELFAAHAPERLQLDDLRVLGPIFVLKLRFTPAGFAGKMVAEMWMYPDDSRVLELSTKCAPADAFQTAAETRAFLAGAGIDTGGEQAPKTRRALEFFSARMQPPKPVRQPRPRARPKPA